MEDVRSFDPVAYINEPRWQASRLGLDRIRDLMERLGRPQDRLRFVHVAGTNGKGSTCAYLTSILQCAGYRTGLFTSPYIERFEERIAVDGIPISPEDLRTATLRVREAAEAQAAETGEHATEFELMTAVALVHFAAAACDIVVLEVGLGGRLDSTNVIDRAEVSVITRIGLDHTDLLGHTLAAIAGEKAGIVKPGCPVVSYPQDDAAAAQVIAEIAAVQCSPLTVADFSQLETGPVATASDCRPVRRFSYRGVPYETRLLAAYQPCNAAVAIEAAHMLAGRGWRISSQAVAQGVAAARWPGRFELVAGGTGVPSVIVDGGHNPQGAQALAQSLADVFPGRRFPFVMGVLADKDYRAMVQAVAPLASAFVTVAPPNPRALPAPQLAETIRELVPSASVSAARTYEEALKTAACAAGPQGLAVAFGSLYGVADVKRAIAAYSESM